MCQWKFLSKPATEQRTSDKTESLQFEERNLEDNSD